jgi:hypothetical protein
MPVPFRRRLRGRRAKRAGRPRGHPFAPTEFPKARSATTPRRPHDWRPRGLRHARLRRRLPVPSHAASGGYRFWLTPKCLARSIAKRPMTHRPCRRPLAWRGERGLGCPKGRMQPAQYTTAQSLLALRRERPSPEGQNAAQLVSSSSLQIMRPDLADTL